VGIIAVAHLLARHVELASGLLVVLPGEPVAGADEYQGDVGEDLTLGDGLGEQLAEEAPPCVASGVQGLAVQAVGFSLRLLLGGKLRR
jgi:hypothetical protein